MEFNDLLNRDQFDPKEVLVLRHRPWETEFRRVLPWLANDRPDLFNAYQQTQTRNVERAMHRATYVASFVGHEAGRAVFVGLYENQDSKPLTYKQYWKVPAILELSDLGMSGFDESDERETIDWFELKLLKFRQEWKGRLIVDWPGLERSWYRWSDRNVVPISAILEESMLDKEMPEWNELVLTWNELKLLPRKWRITLSQWRGIYFILDATDGRGYVGAAYGKDNILGRWLNYASTRHGGNKQLKKRDPDNLRFSILQRVSPDMEQDDIVNLEAKWKVRLHTREFGLNDN